MPTLFSRLHFSVMLLITFILMVSSGFAYFDPTIDAVLERSQRTHSGRMAASGPLDPDIVAKFIAPTPWLTGVNFGGETFNGSIVLGIDFFGSNLTSNDYLPVEIRFGNDDTTLCQTFRRDLAYASGGVGLFLGSAWDISNPGSPRRLNICFVEDATDGLVDLFWAPSSTQLARREYVFVMTSSYDGTGTTYAGDNAFSGANSMDILYGYWPQVRFGHMLYETLPATLTITPYFVKNFQGIPDSSEVTLSWTSPLAGVAQFRIFGGTVSPPTTMIGMVSSATLQFTHSGLTNFTPYFYRVEALDAGNAVIGESPEISVTPKPVSFNINLVGIWNERGTYGDIWGYVDSLGHEYALLCARTEGVSIIDIDVDPPVEVGFIPSVFSGSEPKDVKVYKHYAIVVNEHGSVQIVDIFDVTAPVEVSQFAPDGGGSHNCYVEGDYLYVIGNHGTGGLEIVSIVDPTAPVEVGQFQPFYYHDVDIRNDTMAAAGIFGDGIDLIDLSDKTSPTLIARFNYPGSGAHNVAFSESGDVLFSGDEIGDSKHTRVFDFSDPFNVVKIADIIVDPSAITHNCYILDTLLYIGHYTEGVRVWNVADPANPVEIAYYDTYKPAGYGFFGCWSVDPYLPSGRIIASDMQTGLYVLEMADFSSSCCVGLTGNADGDPDDLVDVRDLVALINALFITFEPIDCPEEANADGDVDGLIDVRDLVALINALFITFDLLPACQ